MATIKGLTLKIDGDTTSLTSALSGVNKSSKDLQSELKEIDRLLKVDPTNTELLTQRQKVLAESIEETGKKLDILREAARQAQEQMERGEVSEEQYRALQREVTKTEQTLNKLEGQAGATGDDLDKAGDQADKAGKDARDSANGWGKLGNGLKTVGGLAVKAVTGLGVAAGAAGGALVKAGLDAMDYTGDIDDAAQRTGMAAEKFQQYAYAAKLSGMETSTLEKAMVKQQKAFSDAKEGSSSLTEAYRRMGINLDEVSSSGDAFDAVISSLAEMDDETTRNAIANDIFGKSYAELAPLLNQGADGIANLKKEAVDLGAVMSDESVAAGAEMGDNIDRLKTSATGAANALGTVFMPVLSELATTGSTMLGDFTSGVQAANGDIGQMGTVVAAMLQQIVTMLMTYLPQLIDSGLQILGAIGQGILDNLPVIISTAVTLVQALLEGLVTALPLLAEGAMQLITALASGLADSTPTLLPAILDAITFVVESLIENAPALLAAALQIITALATGLINYIPVLVARLPEIIASIVTFVSNSLPQIIETAVKIIGALVVGLVQAIPALVASLPQIISAIVGGLLSGISSIVDVGRRIVEGLWEGIMAMGAWIGEKVSGFFSGIVDGVKGMLGIHSPSKVFAGIGGNMAAGLGQGFTASMRRISEDIEKAIPTDLEPTIGYSLARLPAPSATESGTIDTAAVINALGTMLTGVGGGGNGDLIVPINVNGVEFYRATIRDFRNVSAQSPELTGDF